MQSIRINAIRFHEAHGSLSHEDIRLELFCYLVEAGCVHHSMGDLRDASLTLITAKEVCTLADIFSKISTTP